MNERRLTAIEKLTKHCKGGCQQFRECEKCLLLKPVTSLVRHLLAQKPCPDDPPKF